MNCHNFEAVKKGLEQYNLDEVLLHLFDWNTPEEVAEDLQNAYYYIAEWVSLEPDYAGDDVNGTLVGLRQLIEALRHAKKNGDAPLFTISVSR